MTFKRLTLICGHYGSGKTNIAVNLAKRLKEEKGKATLADLDIVNPYFRAKDRTDELKAAGIRLICSEYANSNVDFPALPQEIYSIRDDRSMPAVLDIGGDDRGALALGRLAPSIREENDFEMLMVMNACRPLTPDAPSLMEVLREIEQAGGLAFTGLINNTNVGRETTAETVLKSLDFAAEASRLSGLPVVLTTVSEELYPALEGKIPDLMALHLNQSIV